MTDKIGRYVDALNDADVKIRLSALKSLKDMINEGLLPVPDKNGSVNNHIHTTYSFSPYSPAKAIWMAYNAGLDTAGIIDHDTICGAREFVEAGKIMGIATTIGFEFRTDFSKTSLKGKRFNNPDQTSIAYIIIHAVPSAAIDSVTEYLAPYVEERTKRNLKMVEKMNAIISPFGMQVDYYSDVLPVSMKPYGGSITERHLLYALSMKLVSELGKGAAIVSFLKKDIGLTFNTKVEEYLLDESNPYYAYDLLGALKSSLVEKIYVDAVAECPDISDAIAFSNSIAAISAYPYLGDVAESVTGDKKTQKFEDDYLDELFDVITKLGFKAVTYTPSRNTYAQIKRLRMLCESYGFIQISGEDINTPRQPFICEAMKNPEYKNLIEATWALIGHEKSVSIDTKLGIFSSETVKAYPDISERIKIYESIGRLQSE